MNKPNINKIYEFSKSNSEKYFVNYFDKLIYVAVLFVLVLPAIDEKVSIHGGIIAAAMLVFLALIFVVFHQRFAYKFTVDLEARKIEFHMFRNKGVITTSLNEIKKININCYINFYLDGKKVMYNDVANKQLTDFLSSVAKLNWGFCGRLLRSRAE